MIPEDWEVKDIGKIGTLSKGSGISRADSNTGSIAAIRYGEIYTMHNNYIKKFVSHISPIIAAHAKRLHSGDILFTASGETKEDIAKAVAFVSKEEAYAGGDIIILSPCVGIDSICLGFLLNMTFVVKQRSAKAQGDAVVHITTDSVASIKIPLPSEIEQRRIASALTSIDNLISSLGKLIEKKKNIKQGAMQQLLTGKTRLKGFKEQWIYMKISEVATTSSGGTPSRSIPSYYYGDIKWFTTTELKDSYLYDSIEHITREALNNSSAKMFSTNTILMAMYGATIGKLGILKEPSATNQACCAIKCNDIDEIFLFYILLYNRKSIIEKGCGAGQPNISQTIVNELSFLVPPCKKEQRAIATILTKMDNEITALEAKKTKYEAIKQGMMQQLLTGKIRLIS